MYRNTYLFVYYKNSTGKISCGRYTRNYNETTPGKRKVPKNRNRSKPRVIIGQNPDLRYWKRIYFDEIPSGTRAILTYEVWLLNNETFTLKTIHLQFLIIWHFSLSALSSGFSLRSYFPSVETVLGIPFLPASLYVRRFCFHGFNPLKTRPV